MSPDQQRDFETEWPALARKLERLLSRKRIAASQREDIIQETALRLLLTWDGVDRRRSAWPLTATIALNLVRDSARRGSVLKLVAQPPDTSTSYDVEQAGLARVELDRVRRALATLSEAHRAVLLSEIGGVQTNGTTDAARKMLRMRARRKLQAALEKVSALVALRLRRFVDFVQTALGARESLVQGATCLLCMVFGLGTLGAVPTPVASGATSEVAVVAVAPMTFDSLGTVGPDLTEELRVRVAAQSDDVPSTRNTHTASKRKAGEKAGGTPLVTPPNALPVPTDHVELPGSTGEVPDPPNETPEIPPVPGDSEGPDDGEEVPQPPRLPIEEIEEAAESLIPRSR